MVERLVRNEEVRGSTPLGSTRTPDNVDHPLADRTRHTTRLISVWEKSSPLNSRGSAVALAKAGAARALPARWRSRLNYRSPSGRQTVLIIADDLLQRPVIEHGEAVGPRNDGFELVGEVGRTTPLQALTPQPLRQRGATASVKVSPVRRATWRARLSVSGSFKLSAMGLTVLEISLLYIWRRTPALSGTIKRPLPPTTTALQIVKYA